MATANSIKDTLYQSYCTALAGLNLRGPSCIVVALGGGADSQTVLDLTLRYRQQHPEHRYLAIHLDHAFHPDSPQWADFLRRYCESAQIDYIVEPLAVPVGNRESKEAQGRHARYQRLAELTSDHAVILLGQHLSDQTETFLLQLKRGAGPKGLASMAAVAPFTGARRLCRPLLGHSKADIYRYAEASQLQWIEDDTNSDTRIDRNFLRHDVIPVLKQRWPQFEQTVARAARLCAQQQALLDSLLTNELGRRKDSSGVLQRSGLEQLPAEHQAALLRLYIEQHGAPMPSEAVAQQMSKQLAGQRVCVEWSGWQLRSHQGGLYVVPQTPATLTEFSAPFTASCGVLLPALLGEIRNDGTTAVQVPHTERLTVRFLRQSDMFTKREGGESKAAHRLLKKQGVPEWERKAWPVLVLDETLLWVPSLGINAVYQAAVEPGTELTNRVYPNWVKDSVPGVMS